MHRLSAILLVLALCFSLGACSASDDASSASIVIPPPVEQQNDTLTIYYTDWDNISSKLLDNAAALFQKQYPQIDLRIQKVFTQEDPLSHETAYQKMLSQILVGDGPDLFLLDPSQMDIEKLVRQGLLADLQPFFAADDFDWSVCQKNILDGGIWDEKRLIVPLYYNLPVLYTTKEALAESGFSLEACDHFMGFVRETSRVMSASGGTRCVIRTPALLSRFASISGINYIDYSSKTADLSSAELRETIEWYKQMVALYGNTVQLDGINGAADVRDGSALWLYPYHQPHTGNFIAYGALKTIGSPQLLPIRNLHGGINAEVTMSVAVRSNSANLQNAYQFIKILLSEDFANLSSELTSVLGLPVVRSAYFQYYDDYTAHLSQTGQSPILAGTCGFDAILLPTREEFGELLSYADMVTDVYWPSRTELLPFIRPYLQNELSLEETLQDAAYQLEILLTE